MPDPEVPSSAAAVRAFAGRRHGHAFGRWGEDRDKLVANCLRCGALLVWRTGQDEFAMRGDVANRVAMRPCAPAAKRYIEGGSPAYRFVAGYVRAQMARRRWRRGELGASEFMDDAQEALAAFPDALTACTDERMVACFTQMRKTLRRYEREARG